MVDRRLSLYLKPEDRARLVALGNSLQRHGYAVAAADGVQSHAAVVRALMQYLYDSMSDDEQRRVDAEADALARMYAERARTRSGA